MFQKYLERKKLEEYRIEISVASNLFATATYAGISFDRNADAFLFGGSC